MSASPDLPQAPGVVELREDVPLKPGTGVSPHCAAGPRLILAAFALLSVAITLALLTQIYYGDYEVVPHGSVSTSAAACSRAGVAALREGGLAADAAAIAALCLALLAPHLTSLDASGSVVYWEYRSAHAQAPTVVEWGGPAAAVDAVRPPRLLVALAALHSKYGALPWARVLQPVIELARAGFEVSPGLAAAAAARGAGGFAASPHADPALADYLAALQQNSSTALCAEWSCSKYVTWQAGQARDAGGWRVWAAGEGGARAAAALAAAFLGENVTTDEVFRSVVGSLQRQAAAGGGPRGVASALAAVDPAGTYIALATGLSQAFGSGLTGAPAEAPWVRDEPTAPLDLAPAIIVDGPVCGTRYVIGAESGAALAQGAAVAMSGGGVVEAAEGGRVLITEGGGIMREPGRIPPSAIPPDQLPPEAPTAVPLPALNIVQQKLDALLSHADSRGGGLAARF